MMPLRLLVFARNSPTYPAPGSHQKGEITAAAPAEHVWGDMEGLPDFVRCDLTFANTPDPQWVNDEVQEGGGRRAILVEEAEVDSVIAAGGQRTYTSAGQFISHLQSKSAAAATFVGRDAE